MKVSRYIFYVTIVVLARQVFLGVRQVAANPLNAKSKTTAVFSVHPNNHRAVGIHLALKHNRRARPAQVLLILPRAAAPSLSRDHEVQAGYEGDELAAGAGFVTCVPGHAAAARVSQTSGQLPTVGECLSIDLEAHFQAFYLVRGRCGLFDKPFRNYLFVFPAAAVKHAIRNSRQISRRHTHPMGGMPPIFLAAIEVLEPPMLDA